MGVTCFSYLKNIPPKHVLIPQLVLGFVSSVLWPCELPSPARALQIQVWKIRKHADLGALYRDWHYSKCCQSAVQIIDS